MLVLINLACWQKRGASWRCGSEGAPYVAVWYFGVLLLLGAVAALVWSWRLDQPVWRPDRSLKFIRAAYLWLVISLAMLVLLPPTSLACCGFSPPRVKRRRSAFPRLLWRHPPRGYGGLHQHDDPRRRG